MEVQLFNIDPAFCMIKMENCREQWLKLMAMMEDNNIRINKFYWRSKIDETHLELIEPNVFDAFYFHVDFEGDYQKIKETLIEFDKIKDVYKKLNKSLYTPLEENQIKEIADLIPIGIE